MNMDTQRFATYLLGMDTSGEGEPVVSVDNIKLLRAGHLSGNDRVVINLLVQVARITTGKLHRTKVVHVHIVKVGVDMLAQLKIVIGIHDIAHALLHVVVIYIAPRNGHSVHGNDTAGMLTLIAKGVRQAQYRLDIALSLQAFRDTIVSGGQSTEYVRRILPSKH